MGFASLQAHEKEAFFSLLDEYFQSRPEIFANLSNGSSNGSQGAPAAVSTVAMHRPSDVASKMVSAGLRHAATSNIASRPVAGGGGGGANDNTPASDSEVSSVADRIAAFSLQRNSHLSSSTNNAEGSPSSSSLNSVKKMGDVDTASQKNFFGTLRNSGNLKSASPPPPPVVLSAFSQKQNSLAPPPVRGAASRAGAPEFTAPPPPPPPPRPRQQEEEAGDWADVIYGYDSGDAGDLVITEGETVLITERTSEDWWTGEVNGKKGLLPASYVKLR